MQSTLKERLALHTLGTPYCWIWTAGVDKDGYGRIALGARHSGYKRTHIVAYELVYGPVPEGLVIDHECTNTFCVNPDHLRAVTSRVNTLRGQGPTAINARKTHCPKKHEYTESNTYWSPNQDGWRRSCCTCGKRKPKGKKDWLR